MNCLSRCENLNWHALDKVAVQSLHEGKKIVVAECEDCGALRVVKAVPCGYEEDRQRLDFLDDTVSRMRARLVAMEKILLDVEDT